MGLLDTITSLATASNYVVTRRASGVVTDGVYVAGSSSTFTVEAIVQPATGMQRVVGGKDMRWNEEGQSVPDVRMLYVATELLTRATTNEPDEISIEGRDWTVARVEPWELAGQKFFRVLVSKKTGGAS